MPSDKTPATFAVRALVCWIAIPVLWCAAARGDDTGFPPPSRQPSEPIDITPLDGETYYVLNQLSGLQADLNDNSTAAADHIVQQQPSFTNLSQRWAFTRLSGGFWRIGNIRNGLLSRRRSRLRRPNIQFRRARHSQTVTYLQGRTRDFRRLLRGTEPLHGR